MTYTERDREIARSFSDDQLDLLTRLVADKFGWEELAEKNGLALDDARYGQIMKVNYLVKEHAAAMLTRIGQLAQNKDKPKPATAPR